MRILAFDTATEACSAALLIDSTLIERYAELERGHSEHILAMIDAVLNEGGLTLSGVDAIAFGRGPGAFTGVRLAAAVAQGLAFGAGRPVCPVSDLRALAQRVLTAETEAGAVLVCSDARMHEVYWGVCVRDAHGLAAALGPERVSPAQTVRLPQGTPTPVWGAGRGFRAYPELAARLGSELEGIQETVLPRAREIAQLAAVAVRQGELVTAEQALPVYLRDDVARPPSQD